MTDPSTPGPGSSAGEDGAPVDARSGADVAEAIEVAERGSSVQQVHDRGTEDRSGQAPVEQVRGDPEMTEGEVVLGSGSPSEPSAGLDPRADGSGGAQSQPGARVSDRLAGGEPAPSGPPFEEG
jgi:hypothetical protein